MNLRVEPNRFLSVACDPEERIVFDRKETKYHLLRDSAARLWDEICEGGTFEVAPLAAEGEDPIAMLAEAGLVGLDSVPPSEEGITRRVWLRRTGKASAAAVVLPLVATITTPRLVLGQVPGASLEEAAPEIEGTNSNDLSDPPFQAPETTQTTETTDTKKEKPERLTRDERWALHREGNWDGGPGRLVSEERRTHPESSEKQSQRSPRERPERLTQEKETEDKPGWGWGGWGWGSWWR